MQDYTDMELMGMSAEELLGAMAKSVAMLSLEKAFGGYRYVKRVPKAGGGYRYEYEHPQYGKTKVERSDDGNWKVDGKTEREHEHVIVAAEKSGDDDVADKHTMMANLLSDMDKYESKAAEVVMRAAKREAKKLGISAEHILQMAVKAKALV